jgi:hypothetical protein
MISNTPNNLQFSYISAFKHTETQILGASVWSELDQRGMK